MKALRKLGLAVPVIVQFLLSSATSAQETEPRIDLGFELRINSVRAELRQADDAAADAIQRAFAREAFDYFLQHPYTVTGQHAAEAAFSMWERLVALEEMERALPLLPNDSPAWSTILLQSLSNTYVLRGRGDAMIELLGQLETDLTHPSAQSEVLRRLGEHHFRKEQYDQAVPRFERVVALNASPFPVMVAEGYLYEIESLAIGMIAPEFTVADLDGTSFSLSDMHGSPVLLEFWATWCAPCIPEIPNLKKLHSNYAEEGLQIVGISFDESLLALRQFVEDESLPWRQLPQPTGLPEAQLAKLFNVRGIPRSLLLDREGRIVAKDLRGERLSSAVAQVMRDR